MYQGSNRTFASVTQGRDSSSATPGDNLPDRSSLNPSDNDAAEIRRKSALVGRWCLGEELWGRGGGWLGLPM